MRLLVVTQFFPPDITAAAFRMADTLALLAAWGHDVRVLTAVPHKARADAPEDEADRLDERLRVYRSRVTSVGVGGLRRYVVHYLSFLAGSLCNGLRVRLGGWRPEAIWASSPPIFAGLSGHMLSRLFRCPLVLDVRDIWPESAVAAGQLSPAGRAFAWGKRLEHYLYRRASRITCVAQPMRDYIARHTSAPITIIYNGVGVSGESLAPPAAVWKSNGWRTLLYAGNLGRVQALDTVIRAFAELAGAGQADGWRLRLVGAGSVAEALRVQVRQAGMTARIAIEPPRSRETARREMERATLLFLCLKPDPVLAATIPSKLFDYLLACRPIVAGIVGEGQEILQSTGANLCYDPASIDALKAALASGFEQADELAALAPRNRALVIERFSREQGARLLVDCLESACRARANGRHQATGTVGKAGRGEPI